MVLHHPTAIFEYPGQLNLIGHASLPECRPENERGESQDQQRQFGIAQPECSPTDRAVGNRANVGQKCLDFSHAMDACN